MRHPRLIAAALLLLAAFTWWLAERTASETGPATPNAPGARVADYYVRGLSLTTTTPDGKPGRTLHTAELRHYLADNTTELEDAELTVYQHDQPPWRIHAERGRVSPDGDLVLLQGEVAITRVAAPGIRPLQVLTRDVRVQPRQDYAETDEHVTVTSLTDRIEAVGMQAWLREPARFKFLSQVRGRYVPR